MWHAFGGRFTCDVPRSEELCIGLVVLASGDAHLAITVLCGSVFTFTDFFSAQWTGVNISSIASFNFYPRGVYDIHGSFGTQFYCPQERLFCVPTRAGCARVLIKFGDSFCTVILSFRTLLLSFCRVIFVSFGRSRSEPTLWNCFWR